MTPIEDWGLALTDLHWVITRPTITGGVHVRVAHIPTGLEAEAEGRGFFRVRDEAVGELKRKMAEAA